LLNVNIKAVPTSLILTSILHPGLLQRRIVMAAVTKVSNLFNKFSAIKNDRIARREAKRPINKPKKIPLEKLRQMTGINGV